MPDIWQIVSYEQARTILILAFQAQENTRAGRAKIAAIWETLIGKVQDIATTDGTQHYLGYQPADLAEFVPLLVDQIDAARRCESE